jgi:hypothetical protein
MTEFLGVTVPPGLYNCRNVYLYSVANEWILSTRAVRLATFESQSDAEEWWKKFEGYRGYDYKPPKVARPTRRTRGSVRPTVSVQSRAESADYGWSDGKGICPICLGDGGAAGQCYKCGGSGWA